MTETAALTAFLTARLAEDEAAVKAAWGVEWDWRYVAQPFGERPSIAHTVHIARHDPARVLREVEAKRAVIDRYLSIQSYAARPYDAECTTPEEATRRDGYLHALDVVMRGFATIWRDHPDFDPEWGWGLIPTARPAVQHPASPVPPPAPGA
jgi:hypothetical protein